MEISENFKEFLFQPTPPAQGATHLTGDFLLGRDISTHAPRTGGDRVGLQNGILPFDFNPRPPHRGRPDAGPVDAVDRYFNPRPPHRGRRPFSVLRLCRLAISTHAPRTGGDPLLWAVFSTGKIFQPTPPAQGATPGIYEPVIGSRISTHAPRTGGDDSLVAGNRGSAEFQPTPPAQGATFCLLHLQMGKGISTHAPRTGGDTEVSHGSWSYTNFNPRPPHRGRPMCSDGTRQTYEFQPTPPAQGATQAGHQRYLHQHISTHAPRTGGDIGVFATDQDGRDFNPRPPHRGRPSKTGTA